jgi:catechol 2,3-dioxygenase
MLSTAVEPVESVLHPATRLGAVQLTVANRERSVAFYQQVLGFQVHERSEDWATLGAGCAALLQLVEMPDARQVSHHCGLYPKGLFTFLHTSL